MDKTFTLDNQSDLPSNENVPEFTKDDLTPGEHLLKNIMNYSRALSVLKTQYLGSVNLILN